MDAFFISSKNKQKAAELTAEGNKWPCTWSDYISVIEIYSVGIEGKWLSGFFSPSFKLLFRSWILFCVTKKGKYSIVL